MSRTDVGQPIGSFFLIRSLGVDPNTGDMLFEDINTAQDDGTPDGLATSADRQFVGSPFPDYFGGITNTFSYKGIDLSIFFQFATGFQIYRSDQEGIGGTTNLGATAAGIGMTDEVLNRWRQPGDVTDVPRAVGGAQGIINNQRSSRFLSDGDYLRLKNITIGYTLPSNIVEKAKLRSVRIYVTGQNLLTFTDYSGFDPEISSSLDQRQAGVDQGAIPQLRNVTFGINVGF